MSVEATARAWASNAGGTELLVLLALADFAGGHDDPYDYAYPAVRTIAERTKVAPRTVQRALAQLESEGLISQTGEHLWRPGKTTRQWRIGEGCQSVTPDTGVTQPTPTSTSSTTENSNEEEKGRSESAGRPSRALAHAREAEVPEGFPDELRPHARIVMRVLREAATERGAQAVTARGVGRALMDYPRKPLVATAVELRAWLLDGAGRSRQCRDVVARYRKWLRNEADLAAVERLEGDRVAGPEAGVVPLRRRESESDRKAREKRERTERRMAAAMAPEVV